MPRDASLDDFVHRPRPPVVGENLDLDEAGKSQRFDLAADAPEIDDAVAHHAAVEEEVAGRHEPVADVVGEHAPAAATHDLSRQLRIPPDVVDVERDAEPAACPRVEPVAEV